jgi:hypothetical protein
MQLSTVRFWKFFIQFFIFWFQTNEKKTNFLHEFIEFKENVLQKFSVKINKLFYRFFFFLQIEHLYVWINELCFVFENVT